MKQFFKIMFASAFGLILALLLIVATVAVIAVSSQDKSEVEQNSVLRLTFEHAIKDRSPQDSFKNFDFQSFKPGKNLGLNDILDNIRKAKDNDHIKGIYLDISTLDAGYATAHEIREALKKFRGEGDSGKWIICYSEMLSQKAYYLASVANEIYLNPQGGVQFMGLGSTIPFFTGALEKLEIEAQVLRHGKFKSAVEPFMLDKMSAANREQTEKYVFSIWNHVVEEIAQSRGIPQKELNVIADSLWLNSPGQALELGFVDKLLYKDEVIAALKEKLEITDEKEDVRFVTLSRYNRVPDPVVDNGNSIKREKVAVVYAQGSIVSGKGEDDEIGSETIAKAIRKARENDKVKAIVLRVNSGGGSALASDVMLREMVLAKQAKPVVVSMGDVAASGGYYIACMADTIVASNTTITGSIGVLGILFNAKNFFNNMLGITFDGVHSNAHADMGSPTRPLTKAEKAAILEEIERIYDVFVTHVAAGRPLDKTEVDSIGQGRVWSGADALELGLVDVIGGLDDAVEIAAAMAGLEQYKILELPEIKTSPIEELLAGIGEEEETKILKSKLGTNYKNYLIFQRLLKAQGVQAMVPYDLNPE